MEALLGRFSGILAGFAIAALALASAGCRDTAGFSTGSGHYEGAVVSASFVRSGIADGTRACVTFDADHLQDAPGSLWTSDGRFHATALRPIPANLARSVVDLFVR